MDLKTYRNDLKKRRPKLYAKIEKEWDYKMISPVFDFVMDISKYINPKAKDAVKKEEWLYKGSDIEAEVWKLLKKVRKITLLEKK